MDCGWRVLKTRQFDKNLKKLLKSGVKKDLVDATVEDLLRWVCGKGPLPAKYNLHKLKGNLQDVWDIHLKYDLVLLFKLNEDSKCIYLLNIGSHSEVFK
ncbi:MAG TPA: type II toxin-antitoxin system YafQ family toxin [Aquificaceae bacterium]|nr:type II toxin-antitoxin system YafQ family toxin [Aquificaceae bacterium]